MNNFFQKNLKVLEEKHPLILRKVHSYLENHKDITIPKDERGELNILLKTSDHKVSWLYPSNRKEHVDKILQDVFQINETIPRIVIWLGLGLGDYLSAYMQQPHPQNKLLIIVEPSMDIFCQCLLVSDLAAFLNDPKLIWYIGEPESDFGSFLNTLFDQKILKRHEFQDPVLVKWASLHPQGETITSACKEVLHNLMKASNTTPIDAYYGLLNFMSNLERIHAIPELDMLKDVFKGKPGVMVATGPSLQMAMPYLKQISSKVVMFAVDSALKLLLPHGITPQFTGSIERVNLVSRLFKEIDTSRTILCTTPVCHPSVYETYRGPVLHYVRPHHFLPWIFPELEACSLQMLSVAHVGIHVLNALGCSPIYLVGQDLAFDPYTQKTHTADYEWNLAKSNIKDSGYTIVKAEANNGRMIETDEVWYHYGLMIAEMCASLQLDCYNVIPADYGLKIRSTQRIDYEEAFAKYSSGSSVDIVPLMEKLHLSRNEELGRSTRIKRSLTESLPWIHKNLEISQSISEDLYLFMNELEEQWNLEELVQRYNQLIDGFRKKQMPASPAMHLINPITASKITKYQQKIPSVMTEIIDSKSALEKRVLLLLAWHAEIIVRSQSALQLIEEIFL